MFKKFIIKANLNGILLCSTHKALFVTQHGTITTTTTGPGDNDFQLEQKHIDEVVKATPTLAIISPESWRRTHELFLNHGLLTTHFLRIVAENPGVLTRSPQKIVDSLEHWRGCQFGEKSLHLLLTKYPEMLDVSDGRRLLSRVTYLKTFAGTNKNVWKLLMNCPNLMEQTELCIEEKIEYLTKVMCIEVPEIIKSDALSKEMDEIICRHVFLVRLGLFKPRSPKAQPHEPSKNNRLYQITDTSEKKFATKVCHVSLAEYEAFTELYAREQKRSLREKDVEDDMLSDED